MDRLSVTPEPARPVVVDQAQKNSDGGAGARDTDIIDREQRDESGDHENRGKELHWTHFFRIARLTDSLHGRSIRGIRFRQLVRHFALSVSLGVLVVSAAGAAAETKIDGRLLADAQRGSTSAFFVDLTEQADLSGAAALTSKEEKGRHVFARLREVAARSQPPVEQTLREAGFDPVPFYILNTILALPRDGVSISETQLRALASRPEVARLVAPGRADIPAPVETARPPVASHADLQQNLALIGAPPFHARGLDGRGLVIGISDSGAEWTHPALASRYRGNGEAGVTHDYNWFDPTEERTRVPTDTNGHGTHSTAIAVGGFPGDRVGVAPGAQWIGCRALGPGSNRVTVLACLQFFLAPTDLDGNNPDPDRAPDVTNHSYICPFCELEPAFQALKDAGIMAVAGSGNFGPTCGSVFDPGTYANVLTVGAVDDTGLLTEFSSRGPVENILVKPEIVAPGAAVRSAYLFGGYEALSGTSEASPHVAGAVALLWSARPGLRGDVDATIETLLGAARRTRAADCATEESDVNDLYGHGVLNLTPFLPADQPRRRAVRQ